MTLNDAADLATIVGALATGGAAILAFVTIKAAGAEAKQSRELQLECSLIQALCDFSSAAPVVTRGEHAEELAAARRQVNIGRVLLNYSVMLLEKTNPSDKSRINLINLVTEIVQSEQTRNDTFVESIADEIEAEGGTVSWRVAASESGAS